MARKQTLFFWAGRAALLPRGWTRLMWDEHPTNPQELRSLQAVQTLKQEGPQTPRAPAAGERRRSPQLRRLLSPGAGEQLVPGRALSTAVLSGAHVEPQHLQRHVARAPSAQPPAASKQRRAKHDKLFMSELFAVQRVHQRL